MCMAFRQYMEKGTYETYEGQTRTNYTVSFYQI